MTQSQKFSGSDPSNHNIVVDYVNRSVKFTPVQAKHKAYMLMLSFGACMFVAEAVIIISYVLTNGIMFLSGKEYIGGDIVVGFLLVMAVASAGLYFNKRFMHNTYAKMNFGNFHLMKLLFNGFNRKKSLTTRTVSAHTLVNNKIVLPYKFNNIIFEYETTEDFSEYLEKLEILNIYKEDAFSFFAVFTFKQNPEKGELKVRYL